jgi:Ca-activated chloride channel homolog
MIFEPVVPPLALAAIAVILLAARLATLRRARTTRGSRWRWGAQTAVILLVVLAAARPVLVPRDQDVTAVADREAPNVFVVLDRSPDMQVRDQSDGQSRMSLARSDVGALIDRYPGARFAVVSFSSRATVEWPLSADTWSLRPLVSALTPYAPAPDAVTQANAGAASNTLRYQLIGARQQYPQAKNLVFYLGSGTPEALTPPREFNPPAGAIDGGAVLGYGSAQGGPVPGTDVTRSALDEPALQGIAAELNLPYATRAPEQPLTDAIPANGAAAPRPVATTGPAAARTELYWIPAALAAVLVLTELGVVLREFRRTRFVQTGATR